MPPQQPFGAPARRTVRQVARPPRAFVPGGVYHVYARGSNRQPIFTHEDDRIDFLFCLDGVVSRWRLRCLAYCLMRNHYHLVVETEDGELSSAMKALNGRYSLRFNRRHGHDAHLFKNRFGAVRQESDSQLLWAVRYTVRNPVEQGLCAAPEQWRWSSYRASIGIEQAPRFLDVARLLSYLGDSADRARVALIGLVSDVVGV
jgi:putative transposase